VLRQALEPATGGQFSGAVDTDDDGALPSSGTFREQVDANDRLTHFDLVDVATGAPLTVTVRLNHGYVCARLLAAWELGGDWAADSPADRARWSSADLVAVRGRGPGRARRRPVLGGAAGRDAGRSGDVPVTGAGHRSESGRSAARKPSKGTVLVDVVRLP
jgi:hypothetical protein